MPAVLRLVRVSPEKLGVEVVLISCGKDKVTVPPEVEALTWLVVPLTVVMPLLLAVRVLPVRVSPVPTVIVPDEVVVPSVSALTMLGTPLKRLNGTSPTVNVPELLTTHLFVPFCWIWSRLPVPVLLMKILEKLEASV